MFLSAMGRCDESISEFHRAREVDPLSMIIRLDGAAILYWCRQLDPALTEAQHVLEMAPGFQKAHLYLAGLYAHKGMFEQSMGAYQKWVDLSGAGGTAVATQVHAWLWAMSGKHGDAIQAMAQLRKLNEDSLNSYISAEVDSALGNRDEGLKELEKAFESRDNLIVYMKVDPKLDGLRDDPRFQRLLQKLKLG
jgi:tetratricopeptide (TPR) repeat protein